MEKIVDFYLYCPTCAYFGKEEHEDPCNECLTYPTNEDSQKPVNYKEGAQQHNE